jgi:hypothetical protein
MKVRQVLLSLSMLGLATPAFAATMNWTLTPGLPGHVPNPGGMMSASCWVDTEGTTVDFIRVIIKDPSDVVIFQLDLPGYDYWNLDWTVPDGSPDGIYEYLAEYYSVENGYETSGGEGFLIAGSTRGICAFKFIDEDGDGVLDDDEVLASGWEICFTYPDGSTVCEFTDEDGAACKFFIPAGTFTVCETLQPGYENTLPICTDVIVTDSIEKALFGNRLSATGACCIGEECFVLTEEECLAQGGEYQGDDVPCDDTLCVNTGACCIGVDCVILTEEECIAQGGEYEGDGVPCFDDTCVVVPTIDSSWGEIKSQYR